MPNKIKNNFDIASDSYDLVASAQYKSAKYLVELLYNKLPDFNPKTILDLGTGTGYIPELLINNYNNSIYSLNDISKLMLNYAYNKLNKLKKNNINLILGDMEVINFAKHQLIISNMALQWVKNLDLLINKLFMRTNVLAFSCLLSPTFNSWHNVLKQCNIKDIINYQYPEKNLLEKKLLALNPKDYIFDVKDFVLKFDNAMDFMQYLKKLGANGEYNLAIGDVKKLMQYKNNFIINYRVFFGVLERD